MALDGLDKHRMAPILSANVLDSCTKLVEDVMRVAHHSHCGCVDIKFAAARHVHAQCTRLSPFGTHRGNTLNPLDLDHELYILAFNITITSVELHEPLRPTTLDALASEMPSPQENYHDD